MHITINFGSSSHHILLAFTRTTMYSHSRPRHNDFFTHNALSMAFQQSKWVRGNIYITKESIYLLLSSMECHLIHNEWLKLRFGMSIAMNFLIILLPLPLLLLFVSKCCRVRFTACDYKWIFMRHHERRPKKSMLWDCQRVN
jgi:hypothetical protein